MNNKKINNLWYRLCVKKNDNFIFIIYALKMIFKLFRIYKNNNLLPKDMWKNTYVPSWATHKKCWKLWKKKNLEKGVMTGL